MREEPTSAPFGADARSTINEPASRKVDDVSAVTDDLNDFQAQRPRLFALAYRLLGSASDAEDAVQDTYLRWEGADHAAILNPAAWLTRVLTNLCLNQLTSARARRENYIGPWLPEPVLTQDAALGPLETAQQRESVSMAMLILLEQLTPPERAVFVLREAFGYPHREIAEVLELSEANCQQLYKRAKDRIDQGRPRFTASAEQSRRIAEKFFAAAGRGDLAGLEELLAGDVVAWADSDGKARAARRPVHGADKVARLMLGLTRYATADLSFTEVNGLPAIVGHTTEGTFGAMLFQVGADRVTAVYSVVNPEKLEFLRAQLNPAP